MKIALIGAGAAGAACVSVLRSRGADFCVFEKSRGVGGRMCTRRVSDALPEQNLFYDHGCPQFQLSAALLKTLSDLVGPQTIKQTGDGEWVSVPSMPQLVKDLLGSAPVQTNCEIDVITGETGAWYLLEKQKDTSEGPRRHGPFDKVVLTAPAPQTLNLLRNIEHTWATPLRAVQYSPCWVFLASLPLDPKTEVLPSSVFSEIRCQNLKQGRTLINGISSWVAYTNPVWSQQFLELEQSEALAILNAEFIASLRVKPDRFIHASAHRWRFAQVVQSLEATMLHDPLRSIHYAGDACLGGGVAGALSSGLKVGNLITEIG